VWARDRFAAELARAHELCGFELIAWVVMPEHVHVIIMPDDEAWPVARILKSIKNPIAREAIPEWKRRGDPVLDELRVGERHRFWQAGGGFARNVREGAELAKEIDYIHNNPVKRGLVGRPTEWAWSSARWYAGERDGVIEIDDSAVPLTVLRQCVRTVGGDPDEVSSEGVNSCH
jgi:putative transposase